MKLPKDIPIFGDPHYRGKCRTEDCEQIDFYSWLKLNYPLHHKLMIHPQSEGKRNGAQMNYHAKTGGMPTGASDVIIPGNPCFVVELKRKDHTKSRWQKEQIPYLLAAKKSGCFVGLALGADGLKDAFLQWLKTQEVSDYEI